MQQVSLTWGRGTGVGVSTRVVSMLQVSFAWGRGTGVGVSTRVVSMLQVSYMREGMGVGSVGYSVCHRKSYVGEGPDSCWGQYKGTLYPSDKTCVGVGEGKRRGGGVMGSVGRVLIVLQVSRTWESE